MSWVCVTLAKRAIAVGFMILGSFALFYCASAQDITTKPPAPDPPVWTQGEGQIGVRQVRTTFHSALSSGVAANDSVPISLFLPTTSDGPFPCVLVLHFWGASDHRVENNLAIDLARHGIAAIVMPLPYHIERTAPGTRSGELAITPDPHKLVRTMAQSIVDIRRAFDIVSFRGDIDAAKLGITGTSLGAIVAALASGIDERISAAAFVVGGVDLAHILWNSSRVVKEREILRRDGYTETKLRDALKQIEPSQYLKLRKPLHNYVISAKFDTVVPFVDSLKLVNVLESPHVVNLESGHYGGFFVQKRIQRSVADFFTKCFRGESFIPPNEILGPTIRIGIAAMIGEDPQIGVGLDLIRPKSTDGIFATAFATTDGILLYMGKPLDRGLSAGVLFTVDRPRIGIVWSIVL